jgi:hypothetical protein
LKKPIIFLVFRKGCSCPSVGPRTSYQKSSKTYKKRLPYPHLHTSAKILYINRLCITLYCAVLDSEHQALCGKNTSATLLRHTLKKISTHHSPSDMSSRENMSHSIDSVNIYIHSLYIQERTYNKPSPLSPHIPFSIASIALSIYYRYSPIGSKVKL